MILEQGRITKIVIFMTIRALGSCAWTMSHSQLNLVLVRNVSGIHHGSTSSLKKFAWANLYQIWCEAYIGEGHKKC